MMATIVSLSLFVIAVTGFLVLLGASWCGCLAEFTSYYVNANGQVVSPMTTVPHSLVNRLRKINCLVLASSNF